MSGNLVARVDNHLGDTVFALMEDGSTKELVGYLIRSGDTLGINSFDPVPGRWHFKVARAQLPGGPGSIARLTAAKLDTTYKPGPNGDDTNGTDFIFDLQEANF